MKEFILNGNNFNDMEGFYDEIDKLLTKNLSLKTGHNLHAYNDLLRGGFGVHDYGEPIIIKWLNYKKSKIDLGEELFLAIVEITLDCDDSDHNCKLELYRLVESINSKISGKHYYKYIVILYKRKEKI